MENNFIVITGLPEPYFGLNFRREAPGWFLEEHSHDFHQFFYILEGCLIVRVYNKEYHLVPGQLCMVPPKVSHILYTKEGYLQFGVNFHSHPDERGIIGLLNSCSMQLRILAKPDFIESMPVLKKEAEELTPLSRLKITAALDAFIISCIEDITDLKENAFRIKLVSFLKSHVTGSLKLDAIVKEMAISQTHLERLSNREFGCSVVELFHRLKMDYACSLLVNSSESIQEISYMLGYDDAAYFCRFFKKRFKMTPREYRKRGYV